ncbi:putative Ran GTPase binding protein [Encephalitozoon hellem ATCC 50504]|uniref:Ran GTPase activating protein n=1 Tax=Encephalitozoon hellem TaxID=27973 RepID=A0A9Q9F8Y0_ENCHE|nr:putative Ran GTPase binding protein [Encephalitozoon hellem ATCC 50504]AFM97765.1 putative Ran GTPase binding protein [Encephalitozoon hellem ATCC 50504]UTX42532.1 Ran GTPase activating protein [Encephalitozoon hellem]WEL37987.1 Ran GTPase activating protein [Encephalitozoon hellem]|eukprot:XP_003886746.1 putative Ran GTPase binding protein [Encephalitozoon hellem ATCC 50504]
MEEVEKKEEHGKIEANTDKRKEDGLDSVRKEEPSDSGKKEAETKKTHQSPFLTNGVPRKDEAKGGEEKEQIDVTEVVEKQRKHLEENQNDEVLFKARCKLYYFSEETKALEERAEGTMIIGMHSKSNLVKITVFRDQIGRLGCNHFINPRFKAQPHGKVSNGWMWMSTEDTVEVDAQRKKIQLFVVKFYSEEDYRKFGEEYDLGRIHNEKSLKTKVNKE